MNDDNNTCEKTVALLKIQGLLAGAYDIARHTDHKFLVYLIKMARMEVRSHFEESETAVGSSRNVDGV